VDPVRWPDVARPPAVSPVRTALARGLVCRALDRLPLRVRLGAGPVTGRSGPLLRVADPDAFFARIGHAGLIGFGESYMAGEWDAVPARVGYAYGVPGPLDEHGEASGAALVEVLTVLAAHATGLVPRPLQALRGLWARRRPAAELNSPDGARENVRRHYDLSNELFALFLDETMTYSSALFDALPARPADLAPAQRRKADRLLDLAGVTSGTRLLEIGTGWGELAIRAAERGARVTSVTLSREQRDLALARSRSRGTAGRVSVELCDYREVTGTYDAVVSAEMIEAVGAEYWPAYFGALRDRLVPGGRVALQAITMPHDRMLATAATYTWIAKYVFPGGLIPSREALEGTAREAGLRITADDGFGAHYAETLRLWRERFTERGGELAGLGFDGTFRRLWEFYLAYCEAGFRAGYLDVRQLLLTAGGAR
jgi:cyclopropane-fatty-acyl-phospholipid synthase